MKSLASHIGSAPRILVSRTDALGDLILTTPVYRALKRALPEARISVLCREYAAPALSHNPSLDQVITITEESDAERRRILTELSGSDLPPFDIAIALYPSAFAATLLRDLGIPLRIGTARRWHSWKFTHRVNQSRKRNQQSEAAYNCELLAPLGVTCNSLAPEVFVTEAERAAVDSLLRTVGLDDAFIVLHPGSGGSALDWPLERFGELARALAASGRCVALTGSAAEATAVASLVNPGADRIVSLAGRTDLRTLAALAERAAVVVANSTGPLHLAAAVGTPTVGLFPPARGMSPVRWAPPVDNCSIILPERAKCDCRSACRAGDCMTSISAGRVLEIVDRAAAPTPHK